MKMITETLTKCGIEGQACDRIASMLQATFGSNSKVAGFEHIGEGIAKMTFKFTIRGHGDYLLQIWQEPKLDLTSIDGPQVDQLWPGGLTQVIKNTALLTSFGVRVPRLVSSTTPDSDIPGMAIFEYIDGNLLIEMDKEKIPGTTYSRIGALVGKLHMHTSPQPGASPETSGSTFDCLSLVRAVAMKELDITCEYDAFVRKTRPDILEVLDILHNQALHREIYHLIHGDGLQMIIHRSQEPVLIDIDALQYFDLEYEYCVMDLPFLKLLSNLSFMDSYQRFIRPDCEHCRLLYYRICKLISWLSYFSEAAHKSDNPRLETPYRNTRQWLHNTLKQVEKEQGAMLTRR